MLITCECPAIPSRGFATKSAAPLLTIASEIPNPAAIIITTGSFIESYKYESLDSGTLCNNMIEKKHTNWIIQQSILLSMAKVAFGDIKETVLERSIYIIQTWR
jgi:hypothetical protein